MLKMHSIQIFARKNVAHHILEKLSQLFLRNVVNFHGNTSLQLFDGGWRSGKNLIFYNAPTGKNSMGLSQGIRGAHSPMETILSLKNSRKNSVVCSDIRARTLSC